MPHTTDSNHHAIPPVFPVKDRTAPARGARTSKTKPPRTPSPAQLPPTLEQHLWAIVTSPHSEVQTRQAFAQLAINQTQAIGAYYLKRANDGQWEINTDESIGKMPSDVDSWLGDVSVACDTSLARQSIQIHCPQQTAEAQILLSPIINFGARPEVFCLTLPTKVEIGQVLPTLQRIAAGIQFWLKSMQASKADWKLNSLATLIELVSKIEDCTHRQSAAEVCVNELSRHLGCKIAIGFASEPSRRAYLAAVSGVPHVKRNTRQSWAFQQVVQEIQLRGDEGLIPTPPGHDDSFLLGHKQLAANLQVESVRTRTLETAGEKKVGYLILAGNSEAVAGERMKKFLDASVPRIASAIDVVTRSERSPLVRFLMQIPTWIRKTKTTIGIIIALAVIVLMCTPFPYRIRCDCVIQPVDRRFAVAAFDGMVDNTLAKPGDLVSQGQALAKMDGRSIRWELTGILAEQEQAQKTHEMELAQRNVSQAMLAKLDYKRLSARKKVLEFQTEHLDVRSPISGIVLSGSPEKNNAAAVTTGDPLFEIASIDPLRVEIAIPADDVVHVEPGMPVEIWIEGFERQSIEGSVERIYPRSEIRNSANVFVAEITLDNSANVFRPGMKGVARVDSHRHWLVWNLLHKPYQYAVAHWLN